MWVVLGGGMLPVSRSDDHLDFEVAVKTQSTL